MAAGAVAVIMGLAALPAVVGLSIATPAFADPVPPTPPPAAVNPAETMHVITTSGPTTFSGSITKDTVWGPQGSPYIVGSLGVARGVTLTLLPGTVIKITNGGAIGVTGQLLALGTPQQHVVITSSLDDTVGGDSNGDGAATTPAPGNWYRIVFDPSDASSVPYYDTPTSILEYTDVRYGGWGSACPQYGMVQSDAMAARLIISNSSLSYSQNAALLVTGSRDRGYTGVYNSAFSHSCVGASLVLGGSADIIGNSFTTTNTSFYALNMGNTRFWFNTATGGFSAIESDNSQVQRSWFDNRYNVLSGYLTTNVADWSQNWFGTNANGLAACIDPAVAATMYPPVQTGSSQGSCPQGQRPAHYTNAVLPALSASVQVLPASVREASGPRHGPVNTYLGNLTYQAEDLGVEDAGQRIAAVRTYRSDRLTGGDAGPGWTSSYAEALSSQNGVATLSLGDGAALPFTQDPSAGYTPAPGVFASFASSGSGSTVTTPGQTGYQFNPAGELTAMTLGDPGHRVDVQHSGGAVSRVTGVSGRHLDYTRGGGLLSSVSDGARTVGLSYAGGRLAAVSGVDGQSETYEYDGSGHLTRVATPLGRTKLAAGYDDQGRVAWLEQQGSGRTTFAYDTVNARTTVTRPDGSTVVQQYDWAGRVIAETAGGTTRRTVYDGDGHVAAQIEGVPGVLMDGYSPPASTTFYNGKGDPVLAVNPSGRYTKSTFTADHKPLTDTHLDNSVTTRTYDTAGRLATITDALGKVWQVAHNDRGQVTTQTDPLGRQRTQAYAANGDLASLTDETGAVTGYGYDDVGRRTSLTNAVGDTQFVSYTTWDAVATTTSGRGGVTTVGYDADRATTSRTDAAGHATTYEYDAAGRLSAVVDPADGRTVTEYDSCGRRSRVVDPRGSATVSTYSPEGWLATTTDARGGVTSYRYDPAGRIYRTTDALGQVTQQNYNKDGMTTVVWTPDGAKTSYTYDKLDRQATVTTPRNFVFTTTYDLAGHITQTFDPLNFTTSVAFDAAGRPIRRTDENGVVTTVAYNDAARTVTLADPLGVVSTTTRDAAGRVVAETDGGGVTTSYQYDEDGNLSSVTDPAGTTGFEYDLDGRATALIDPLDRRTTTAYDTAGRVSVRQYPDETHEVWLYDAAGNTEHHVDRTDADWSFQYDAANKVTAAFDPLEHQTTYTYDALNRRTSTTDPSNVVMNAAYDAMGRPAVAWDVTGASWVTLYDLDGNVSKISDPAGINWTMNYNGRGELTRRTIAGGGGSAVSLDYTYDKVGRLLTAREPYLTTYEYDARGRNTARVDAVGGRTTFGYDGSGRQTSETSPGQHTSSWSYDAAGRLLTATDPVGNASQYAWNAADELTKITSPLGGTQTFTYDPAARMHTETDALDRTTTYEYDGEGRLLSTGYPSGRFIESDYDRAGRLNSVGVDGEQRTFGYDPAGRLVSATATGAPDLGFSYDNRGLLTGTTSGLGSTTYGYDNAQRLITVAPPNGPTTTYTYGARGLLATVRGPVNHNFGYNNAGQITSRSAVSPSTTGSETRTYDVAGRIKTIDGPIYDATIAYQPDGQIATVTGSGTTPQVTTYTHDAAGRLLTEAVTQGTTTLSSAAYAWDGDGNRTGVTTNGQPAVTAAYDLADQLTSTSDGSTFGFTSDGLLESGAGTSYTYNGFGDLTSATTASSTVTYLEDAFGRVASRTASGATTAYGYEGTTSSLMSARTAAGPTTTAIRRPDGDLIAEATTGATSQQAWLNVHGDLVALKEDTASTVRWQASYNAFGRVTSTTGTAAVPLTYQSMLTEPITGLVDLGARFYDPAAGRFTARDTVVGAMRAPTSLNRFLYGNGDPADFADPDGHWPEWLDDAVDWAGSKLKEYGDWWWGEWERGFYTPPAEAAKDDDVVDYTGRVAGTAVTSFLEGIAGTFKLADTGVRCAKYDDSAACDDWHYAGSYDALKESLGDTLGSGGNCVTTGAYQSCGLFAGTVFGLKGLGRLSALRNDLLGDARLWESTLGDTASPLARPVTVPGIDATKLRSKLPSDKATPFRPASLLEDMPGNRLDIYGLFPSEDLSIGLAQRAGDLNRFAPAGIARDRQTVAVVRAQTPFGWNVDVVAGSGRGLIGSQSGALRNEVPAPNIRYLDAEVTAFRYIDKQGWQPVAGGASKPVCWNTCAPWIVLSGGRMTGPVYWSPKVTTERRSFDWPVIRWNNR